MEPPVQAIADPAFLIADAAHRFRNSRDWCAPVSIVLEQVGRGLGLSRAYLFQVHELPDGGLGQSCRADWAAPGLKRLTSAERKEPERILEDDELMQRWAEHRRRGEMIEGHTRDLTGRLRELFDAQQTKSFMSFPIWVNGAWWGHVGFDECRHERRWTLTEKSVLRSIAYLLGDAVELSVSSLVMSEATRLAILNSAPDGVVVIDEAGAILEFNPAAERIFGRRHTEVLGRRILDLLVPPANRPLFARFLDRLRKGRGDDLLGRRVETWSQRPDGSTVPIELAVTEIKHTRRRLFVAYVQDLTERKRAEEQAARQREALHQNEKMAALGSLLAGVAHELNNPLSVVVGRAIMLEELSRDPGQLDLLRRLREAAERCAKVSKTFLAIARQSPATRAPVRLNKAMIAALDLVSYSLRASGIDVRLDLDDDLPEVTADFDQLVQVFVNLIVNAEHAMRETSEGRRLTLTSRFEPESNLVIAELSDTGPGIPPEIRARIFEPFFTTKPAGVGTGMGLAVSFGMVTANGGKLDSIDLPSGRGACFRVSFPASAASQASADAAPKAPPPQPAKRILIVDDEPEIVSLLRDILERAGHRVDHAEHGLEALAKSAQADYDAIFCDLRMPGLDGTNFRKRLLAEKPAYRSRMIFVTGDLLGKVRQESTLDGCPVIEKPFYAQTVLQELARLTS